MLVCAPKYKIPVSAALLGFNEKSQFGHNSVHVAFDQIAVYSDKRVNFSGSHRL